MLVRVHSAAIKIQFCMRRYLNKKGFYMEESQQEDDEAVVLDKQKKHAPKSL
jgi:hypothetical protein